MLPLCSKA
jgi:hypothetical protein